MRLGKMDNQCQGPKWIWVTADHNPQMQHQPNITLLSFLLWDQAAINQSWTRRSEFSSQKNEGMMLRGISALPHNETRVVGKGNLSLYP